MGNKTHLSMPGVVPKSKFHMKHACPGANRSTHLESEGGEKYSNCVALWLCYYPGKVKAASWPLDPRGSSILKLADWIIPGDFVPESTK